MWVTTIGSTVDSTVSNLDVEETFLSPTWAPRVGADPVVGSIFGNTPTNDLDGVTSELVSFNVVVDSTLVAHEVLVDSETSFQWAILVDF